MPDMSRMFKEVHESIERRDWLLKIRRMELECGIDPWYGEFSEWVRELIIPEYKKIELPRTNYRPTPFESPYETEMVWM